MIETQAPQKASMTFAYGTVEVGINKGETGRMIVMFSNEEPDNAVAFDETEWESVVHFVKRLRQHYPAPEGEKENELVEE